MFFAGLDQAMAITPRRPRILAHIVLAVYALLAAPFTLAQDAPPQQGLNYNVQIEAPGGLDDLLRDNLDLLRWRGNPRVDLPQLRRLVRDAPEQARALVETEGYYTPRIDVRLDTS